MLRERFEKKELIRKNLKEYIISGLNKEFIYSKNKTAFQMNSSLDAIFIKLVEK